MADELSIGAMRVTLLNAGVQRVLWDEAAITVDVAGSQYGAASRITVATSATPFLPTNVAVGGYVALKNLDATNFIDIYPDTAGSTTPLVQLLPGDVAIFRVSASAGAPRAIADTSSCDMLVAGVDL